jgi:hypothetical protein
MADGEADVEREANALAATSPLRVFISYSRRNSEFADKLAKDLTERGFEAMRPKTLGGTSTTNGPFCVSIQTKL